MVNLHYSIHIAAPREKVWNVMLEDVTYREWASVFMPGSYYQGEWVEGSKILFLGPGENGERDGGMAAIVKEYRPAEFLSLQYYAEIRDGVEVPWEAVGGFENYTLNENEEGTEVLIDLLNLPDEYADMFNGTWPNALAKLKEMIEK